MPCPCPPELALKTTERDTAVQRAKALEKDVSDRDEEIEKLSSKKMELEYDLSQRVLSMKQMEKTLKDVRAEKVMPSCAGLCPSF